MTRLGKSQKLKGAYRCLNCDKVLDGATGLVAEGEKDTRPKPGDATVCAYCQHILIYAVDGFRNPTFTELNELADDPRIVKIKPILKKVFK